MLTLEEIDQLLQDYEGRAPAPVLEREDIDEMLKL